MTVVRASIKKASVPRSVYVLLQRDAFCVKVSGHSCDFDTLNVHVEPSQSGGKTPVKISAETPTSFHKLLNCHIQVPVESQERCQLWCIRPKDIDLSQFSNKGSMGFCLREKYGEVRSKPMRGSVLRLPLISQSVEALKQFSKVRTYHCSAHNSTRKAFHAFAPDLDHVLGEWNSQCDNYCKRSDDRHPRIPVDRASRVADQLSNGIHDISQRCSQSEAAFSVGALKLRLLLGRSTLVPPLSASQHVEPKRVIATLVVVDECAALFSQISRLSRETMAQFQALFRYNSRVRVLLSKLVLAHRSCSQNRRDPVLSEANCEYSVLHQVERKLLDCATEVGKLAAAAESVCVVHFWERNHFPTRPLQCISDSRHYSFYCGERHRKYLSRSSFATTLFSLPLARLSESNGKGYDYGRCCANGANPVRVCSRLQALPPLNWRELPTAGVHVPFPIGVRSRRILCVAASPGAAQVGPPRLRRHVKQPVSLTAGQGVLKLQSPVRSCFQRLLPGKPVRDRFGLQQLERHSQPCAIASRGHVRVHADCGVRLVLPAPRVLAEHEAGRLVEHAQSGVALLGLGVLHELRHDPIRPLVDVVLGLAGAGNVGRQPSGDLAQKVRCLPGKVGPLFGRAFLSPAQLYCQAAACFAKALVGLRVVGVCAHRWQIVAEAEG